MCIAAFAWRAHPRWRLIAAANRDEFHARPAEPLARWASNRHIIAGRDLQSGGTWLGVSTEARFALVTNLRGYGAPAPDRSSRGHLVAGILAGSGVYADPDLVAPDNFNPFSLLLADSTGARFLSNQPYADRRQLNAGVYGLSNGALDEPWPKTVQLKAAVLRWLEGKADDPASLLTALTSETITEDALITGPADPAPSPIFIRNPTYGTRCSTVVAIDREGVGTIIERRFAANGDAAGHTVIDFSWSE